MNRLEDFAGVFDAIQPFAGDVPQGYAVDFLGILTDARFRTMFGVDPATVGGCHVTTKVPRPDDGDGHGEDWIERVNWFAAARDARDRFVMITLGANYGAQAVGSIRALQLINPLPYKVVAIEPVPENYAWMVQHLRDNGIDPEEQWLLQTAINDSNKPVFFPVGSPGTGTQNCVTTNEPAARRAYADDLIGSGRAESALRNLLNDSTTGIIKNLVPGRKFEAEIKLVSAVTLKDLLGPFELVDYIEADIQQSEILVFPPFMDLLKRKVRRIHIGTHGKELHWSLHELFKQEGWEVIFSYEPNASFTSAMGSFKTNDGMLTVRNPGI
jgi:FkbM family methyltransferase